MHTHPLRITHLILLHVAGANLHPQRNALELPVAELPAGRHLAALIQVCAKVRTAQLLIELLAVTAATPDGSLFA